VVDLATRVEVLEQEVAQVRDEGKDIHQAQIRVLNSLRITQIEHGETLKAHGEAIGGLRTEVGSLRTEVGGLHTEVGSLRTEVRDLRETQQEHGRVLHEHSRILHEHGRLLREIGMGMAGITSSLDYLIHEQGKPRP